jgi:hypothetical protein
MNLKGQILRRVEVIEHGTPKTVWTAKGNVIDCGLKAPSVSKLVVGSTITFVETRTLYAPIDCGALSGDKITVDGVTYDIISAAPIASHHIEGTVRKCQ